MQNARVHNIMAALVLVTGVSVSVWAKQESEPKIQGSVSTKGMTQSEYPTKAKLTLTEASAIALNQTPGNIFSVGLENEDGYLVYAVNVAGRNAGFHEIIIDAGNGHVLSSVNKKDSHKEDEEDED